MRIRSVIITAVAGLAFVGASATAAQAGPKGPGGINSNTPTTAKPCCKDIQNPTTTTVKPKPNFEGPDKLSDTPKDPVVDPAPPADPQDGPQDKAPVPPKGDDGIDPGEYGNGSGSDKDYLPPANGGSTGGQSVDTPADDTTTTQVSEDLTDSTDLVAEKGADASNVPAFMIIFFALLTAALIGLVVARMRRDDEAPEAI